MSQRFHAMSAKISRNERKDFYKILSIGADFGSLFLWRNYLALAET